MTENEIQSVGRETLHWHESSTVRASALSLVVFVLFIPFVTGTYGVHNDYSFFQYEAGATWWDDFPETVHLVAIGRPVGAFLVNFLGLFTNDIGDFEVARFISVICIVFAQALYTKHLLDMGVSSLQSAVASVIGFINLAAVIFVMWVALLVPGSLNVLISIVAYLTFDAAWRRWERRDRAQLSRLWLLAMATISGALFICAMLNYPMTAIAYLTLTAARCVLSPVSDWSRNRVIVFRDIALAVVMFSVLLIYLKYILPNTFQTGGPYDLYIKNLNSASGGYGVMVIDSLASRVTYLIDVTNHLIPEVSNIAWAGFLTMLSGVIVFFAARRNKAPGGGTPDAPSVRIVVERGGGCLVILGCAIGPLVLSGTDLIGYRMLFVPLNVVMVVFLAIVSWGLGRKGQVTAVHMFASFVSVALLAANLLQTSMTLTKAKDNFIREYQYAKSVFQTELAANHQRLFLRLRKRTEPYVDYPLKAEFALTVTHSGTASGLRRAILDELGQPYSSVDTFVIGEDTDLGDGELIVVNRAAGFADLNDAADVQGSPFQSVVYADVTRISGEADPYILSALDLQRHTAWPVQPGGDVQIVFDNSIELRAIRIIMGADSLPPRQLNGMIRTATGEWVAANFHTPLSQGRDGIRFNLMTGDPITGMRLRFSNAEGGMKIGELRLVGNAQ